MTPAPAADAPDELRSAWTALAPHEQGILQVLAVAYSPIARSHILNVLRKLDIRRNAVGRALTSDSILPALDHLASLRLLGPDRAVFSCRREIAVALVRDALADGSFPKIVQAIREAAVPLNAAAELWIALHEGDAARLEALLRRHRGATVRHHPLRALHAYFGDAVASWPEAVFTEALALSFLDGIIHLTPTPDDDAQLAARVATGTATARLRCLLAARSVLRGRFDEVAPLLAGVDAPEALAVSGWLALATNHLAEAASYFDRFAATAPRDQDRGARPIEDLTLLWRVVVSVHQGDFDGAAGILGARGTALHAGWMQRLHRSLKAAVDVGAAAIQADDWEVKELGFLSGYDSSPFDGVVARLALYWIDPERAKEALSKVVATRGQLDASGFGWLASTFAELEVRLTEGHATAPFALLDAMRTSAPWQRALSALERLVAEPVRAAPAAAHKVIADDTRLAWIVTLGARTDLRPVEQKRQGKGQWSKGRPVALKRLHEDAARIPYLTDADRRVIACISADTYRNSGGYPETSHVLAAETAFDSLVGHPSVFVEGDLTTPVEVVRGEPVLEVREEGAEIVLRFVPTLRPDVPYAVALDSPTRLSFVRVPPALAPYATVIGDGIRAPRSAKEQVTRLLGPLAARVPVHSGVGGAAEALDARAGDPAVLLQLRPHGGGLAARLVVRPLADAEALLVAGSGGDTLLLDRNGRRVQVRRDLAEETRRAEAILDAFPTLRRFAVVGSERTFVALDDCLALLVELMGHNEVAVVWTAEPPWKVHPVSPSDLALRWKHTAGGFLGAGAVTVGSAAALELPRLLDLLEATPGRFVRLAHGEFLALSEGFRQTLDDLAALGERRKDGVQLHPLALASLSASTGAGPFQGDVHLQRHLALVREADTLAPEVPSTFAGELRDYQLDGFRWMSRLAHWGAGACLADDMGLGKTVEVLAVLVARAAKGPALVIAPTSVCPSWAAEARRFAPTLRVVELGGRDRAAAVRDAGPFDLVVASYGVLVESREALASRAWRTVVLDEAQAIKNASTQRSLAAASLRGDFTVAATGTPVENHVGELWALFRCINPGLLGSQQRFDARFAAPIEKHHDGAALDRLKRLVGPFILRRTKAQVLPELPPRTDVTRYVDLGPEEAALYEALRARALSSLTGGAAGHVQVLAEITKLRRAVCHPRLVVPDTAVEGARLAAFGELVDELCANRHKALVFSQFVDHLTILREHLDARGIAYQYLDGATPAAERKRRVDAFQAGEGDLFLISLRAGGTGLTLTAADYVIHMDPWWNPAVEQQASDRAHRIGQERPVTVYRMVARHTIEEKIVALHERKRALAEGLLEGVDLAGKVSVDELLSLLTDAGG